MNVKFVAVLFQAVLVVALADEVRVSIDAPVGDLGEGAWLRASAVHNIRKRQTCGEDSLLTSSEQQEAIDELNRARALETASNMLKLSFSDSAARMAQQLANTCVFAHDLLNDCDGNRLGQNLYIMYSSAGFPDLNMAAVIQSWNDERKNWDEGTLTCADGTMCGHYTQDVWARTSGVGCGYAKCPTANVNGEVWNNALLVACDFTPAGNVIGEAPYIQGASCTNCDSDNTGAGFNCEDGLCVPT